MKSDDKKKWEASRRSRSVALAWLLGTLALLFYGITIVKFG